MPSPSQSRRPPQRLPRAGDVARWAPASQRAGQQMAPRVIGGASCGGAARRRLPATRSERQQLDCLRGAGHRADIALQLTSGRARRVPRDSRPPATCLVQKKRKNETKHREARSVASQSKQRHLDRLSPDGRNEKRSTRTKVEASKTSASFHEPADALIATARPDCDESARTILRQDSSPAGKVRQKPVIVR